MLAFLGIALLFILGVPLFIIIGTIGISGFYFLEKDIQIVYYMISELYRLTEGNANTLVAIPLFTFAGYILSNSNASKRVIRFVNSLLGWLPGGVAIVCVLTSAVFTAFTGASGITIIALGGLIYPILRKEGYSEKFSLGLITASGSIGLLFAPSLPMILYGVVSKQDINVLFKAGLVPGILLITAMSIFSFYYGMKIKRNYTFSLKEISSSFFNALWELPLPALILFLIYGGYITAQEAAVLTVVYVFLVEVIILREIDLKHGLFSVFKDSAVLNGSILIILGMSLGFTYYLTDQEIPQLILKNIRLYIDSKIVFLLLLNGFLLVVGCMMDIFSAIIIVLPLLLPIAGEYGINTYHLGIIFLTNLEIGYLTPPVGINLFISSSRFDKPVLTLYKASFPFLILMLICLLLITYLPQISLFFI